MRHRAFPVGACHMNGLVSAVRMIEMFVKQVRVVQIVLIGSCPDFLEYGRAVIQILDGFLVIHLNNKLCGEGNVRGIEAEM